MINEQFGHIEVYLGDNLKTISKFETESYAEAF